MWKEFPIFVSSSFFPKIYVLLSCLNLLFLLVCRNTSTIIMNNGKKVKNYPRLDSTIGFLRIYDYLWFKCLKDIIINYNTYLHFTHSLSLWASTKASALLKSISVSISSFFLIVPISVYRAFTHILQPLHL